MLYITTRCDTDTFTAHRALTETYAPDGGIYVPFRLPLFTSDEISAMKGKTFSTIVAEILNSFFSSRLNGWDVDFCIGRNACRLVPVHHKIMVAELWHNLDSRYDYIVDNLYKTIVGSDAHKPQGWFKIAARIAVLFAVYGELLKQGTLASDESFDVSVSGENLSGPVAAWYARRMGLPIGKIICAFNENSIGWELLQRGVFHTSSARQEMLMCVERLIHGALSYDDVQTFRSKCQTGQTYMLNEVKQKALSEDFFCPVVSDTRAAPIISSVYKGCSYLIDPPTSLCYGALQDYRANTGSRRITLLLAERTPLDFAKQISASTGISDKKLIEYVNLS